VGEYLLLVRGFGILYRVLLILLFLCSPVYAAHRYNSNTGTRDYCLQVSTEDESVESKKCIDLRISDGSLSEEDDYFLIEAGAATGGYTSMTTSDTAVSVSYSYTKKAIATDPAFQTGTLADGSKGKLLTIEITEVETAGDTWTLTPTTSTGFSSIVLSDYSLTSSDYTIVVDASSNTVDITLPSAPQVGRMYVIKCEDDTNTVTIDRNGNNIDGDASDLTLIEDEVVQLQFNGTGWFII